MESFELMFSHPLTRRVYKKALHFLALLYSWKFYSFRFTSQLKLSWLMQKFFVGYFPLPSLHFLCFIPWKSSSTRVFIFQASFVFCYQDFLYSYMEVNWLQSHLEKCQTTLDALTRCGCWFFFIFISFTLSLCSRSSQRDWNDVMFIAYSLPLQKNSVWNFGIKNLLIYWRHFETPANNVFQVFLFTYLCCLRWKFVEEKLWRQTNE